MSKNRVQAEWRLSGLARLARPNSQARIQTRKNVFRSFRFVGFQLGVCLDPCIVFVLFFSLNSYVGRFLWGFF